MWLIAGGNTPPEEYLRGGRGGGRRGVIGLDVMDSTWTKPADVLSL